MSLLVVGTVAFDSVETPFGQRTQVLGGSASYLSTAASYFCSVQMAGVVGEDFPTEHRAFFERRGIDISNLQTRPGETFRWRGHYQADMNTAHTLETQLNVLKSFDPHLSGPAQNADFVALGNFDPALQLQVLDQVKAPRFIACDTMNFWIDRHQDKLASTLARIDLLCINEGEARQLSGESNLIRAARVIRGMGPRAVVIKRGEYGAALFDENGIFVAPAFLLEDVVDPTGAGDSFAGGMLGYLARLKRIDGDALRQAIRVGSVLASFVVQDFSLDRLRSLSQAELGERMREYNQRLLVSDTPAHHFDTSIRVTDGSQSDLQS